MSLGISRRAVMSPHQALRVAKADIYCFPCVSCTSRGSLKPSWLSAAQTQLKGWKWRNIKTGASLCSQGLLILAQLLVEEDDFREESLRKCATCLSECQTITNWSSGTSLRFEGTDEIMLGVELQKDLTLSIRRRLALKRGCRSCNLTPRCWILQRLWR